MSKLILPRKPGDRLTSNITPHELGKAMSALDLSTVPPNKRMSAVLAHLNLIMATAIDDRDVANDILNRRMSDAANKRIIT